MIEELEIVCPAIDRLPSNVPHTRGESVRTQGKGM